MCFTRRKRIKRTEKYKAEDRFCKNYLINALLFKNDSCNKGPIEMQIYHDQIILVKSYGWKKNQTSTKWKILKTTNLAFKQKNGLCI